MDALPEAPAKAKSVSKVDQDRHPLNSVRAILIMGVVAGHLELTDFFVGGQSRVVGFFAISGFVITWILVREHQQKQRVAIIPFYLKRSARIFPALIIACGLTALCSAAATNDWWPAAGTSPSFTGFTIFAALSQSLAPIAASGAEFSYELVPVWSLNIEQYFYILIAPTVAWFLMRRSYKQLAVFLMIAATASFLWSTYLTVTDADLARIDYGMDTRGGALLLGAAVAVLVARGRLREFIVAHGRLIALIGAVSTILLGTRLVIDTTDSMTTWAQPAFAAAILAVVVPLWHDPSIAGRWFTGGVFAWLGVRTYSIFLFHVPIMQLFGGVTTDALTNLAILAVTIVLAAVCYRWIESPLRDATKRYLQRRSECRASS